jgi:hypothetical protein
MRFVVLERESGLQAVHNDDGLFALEKYGKEVAYVKLVDAGVGNWKWLTNQNGSSRCFYTLEELVIAFEHEIMGFNN